MALAYTAQILLGPVAQGLSDLILDEGSKVLFCREQMESLKRTVIDLNRRIENIDRLDQELNDNRRPDLAKLKGLVEDGKQLVSEGSNIQSWDCITEYSYSNRITKLEKDLLRFIQVELPVEILVQVVETNRKLDRLSGVGGGTVFAGVIPQLPDRPVGLDVPLQELKMELFRDGNTVVGVCAAGGCGKTTLASKLCRDDEVQSKFKKIFFLCVSSSSNWMLVLQRFWKQIRGSETEFLNIEDAVTQLEGILEEESEPILLVLDDVWSEPVLRKHTFKQTSHKILVTSRSVFKIFDSTYHLRMLGEGDAKTLFCNSAFPEDGNYDKPNDNLVNQVVKGCNGYPLTLTVIGKSLYKEPPRKWQSMATMLSQEGEIFDAHEDVLHRLSLSVDFMKPKLRECFFDLGFFPKEHWIPSAALIDMWIELYKLDESGAYVNLRELSSKCLINLVGDARKDAGEIDGNFNELFVTQHDLLRNLAIHKSKETSDLRLRLVMDRREDDLPKSWKEYQNQQFKSRIVSIHTVAGEMEASSWFGMEFPDAEVLILNFAAKNYCLPPFLRKMEKLKVLIITNHGSKHAKLSGFPPVSCLPNLRRVRLEKISIPSLGEIKDPLENLQKLSLVLCEVGEAMKNRMLDYSAIFPNLTEIDIDYCNDLFELPSRICGIYKLQKLSITNCHNLHSLPESIDQIGDMEVLRLHACTRLKEVPDWICRLKKLRFMDISDCLNMEKIPEDFGQLQKLRKLDLRKCSRLSKLPRSSKELKQLEEVICDEETATLWKPLKRHLSKLEIKVREEDINLHWLGFDPFRKHHS